MTTQDGGSLLRVQQFIHRRLLLAFCRRKNPCRPFWLQVGQTADGLYGNG